MDFERMQGRLVLRHREIERTAWPRGWEASRPESTGPRRFPSPRRSSGPLNLTVSKDAFRVATIGRSKSPRSIHERNRALLKQFLVCSAGCRALVSLWGVGIF